MDFLDFTCDCVEEFSGKTCDVVSTCNHPNMTMPCSEFSVCQDKDTFYEGFVDSGSSSLISWNITDFRCKCMDWYTGALCDVPYDPCTLDKTCKHDGLCTSVKEGDVWVSFECDCTENYQGDNCEIGVNGKCSGVGNGGDSPCFNGGACFDSFDNLTHTCVCDDFFTGDDCGIALTCDTTPCENNGVCSESVTGGYECDCTGTPFYGSDCHLDNYCFEDSVVGHVCNNGTCANNHALEGYECTCPEDYYGENCEIHFVCEPKPRDIIFVVDGSGSIQPENWPKQLAFLQALIGNVLVSEEGSHVSMIQYTFPGGDGEAKTEFGFISDEGALIDAIGGIEYANGFTLTGGAIQHALDTFQGRPGVETTIVVLTDGASFDDVSAPSSEARENGVNMVAIGVGAYDEQQLALISDDVFTVDNFDGLLGAVIPIAKGIC